MNQHTEWQINSVKDPSSEILPQISSARNIKQQLSKFSFPEAISHFKALDSHQKLFHALADDKSMAQEATDKGNLSCVNFNIKKGHPAPVVRYVKGTSAGIPSES